MKRFFLLLSTLALIGVLVSLLTVHRQPSRDPLELVPRQAVLLLDWTDVAGAAAGFLDSRFGRSLTGIDWSCVLTKLEVSAQTRQQLETAAGGLLDFVGHPLFGRLFSQRVVVALLPVDSVVAAENPRQALADHLLMLVNTGHGQAVPELFSLLPTVQRKRELPPYQGIAITVFSLAGGWDLYVASVDGLLVISPGPAMVRHSIDLSLEHLVRERTGFVLNKEYATLKERAQGRDDFFLYADFARLKPMLKVLGPVLPAGIGRQLPEFSGAERMVFFHKANKKNRQFTSIVQFDPEQLSPFQNIMYTRKPLENRSLLNMPTNLQVYFWSNWLDLTAWWRTTLARGTEDEAAAAGRLAAWIEGHAGMGIDEFLALFGREFGFNISEISTSGFFPVPRICCWIELADRDKAGEFLEKMVSGLPLRRDNVAGIPVVSIMMADGLMQPSYALMDRFLVVADSRQQIEDILRLSSKRLVSDPMFQAVDIGMLQPSNLVVFARTAEIIDGLKELAAWVGTIVAVRDEGAGAKSKVLIDRVIIPLLDGLKMYRAKGIRSYTAPGELVLDSVVFISEPGADEP
jgi:hypothetical protein